ncbi:MULTISPECIES: peptide deformylase [unclassified Crossiella]|uniref:peptide deformylase n=1 Tax=unclassified Crossiella TaxID=2620835 RepID=UPI001FFF7C28|nr:MULTISPECIES: peptide deformylase [unclassified Crossiella]MCK2238913.1 peptide deformylase [Crossiella sp. S99.2]MCK2251517.1 peptide deformylase [Crossiella sp. S99.1]
MVSDEEPPGEDVAHLDAFIAELRRWRDVRGLSRTALANAMGYSRSYVSKVESAHERPSREFAKAADEALRAAGALRRAWRDYDTNRPVAIRLIQPSPEVGVEAATGSSLLVEHDDAELHFDGHSYRATMRRKLVNSGTEPITRYLIRIAVDRYPDNPEQSNRLYRDNPLTWNELALTAWWGEGRAEPMHWVAQHDRDAFKELWLLFANDSGHFPLYPGQSTWIEYTYSVRAEKWGPWFRRAVRLPTKRLSMRLDFPAELEPTVWGLHTSMTAEAMPFRTAIDERHEQGRRVYSWATEDPPLHARYRLEWHFRAAARIAAEARQQRPSEVMQALGVLQRDDPLLHRPARPFVLPDEAEDARRVLHELRTAAKRICRAHTFGKGMGLAANQLGIDRAAALVLPPGSEDLIMLLNPRIIEIGDQTDEQYEGCLSFFDVRGLVTRPLALHVEHQELSGARRITIFSHGVARLIAHEVDHLHGVLYPERMRTEAESIPVAEYQGTGMNWEY